MISSFKFAFDLSRHPSLRRTWTLARIYLSPV